MAKLQPLLNHFKGCDAMKRKDTLKVDDVKETSEIVHAALKQLNSLPDNISKGAVTGKEVENYKKQANRLKVLCEAGNIGKSKLVPQFTEISIALQVCVDKLNMVKEYQVKLVVVKDYCKLISKELTQVICDEIDDNSDNKLYDKQISSVCKDLGNKNYECSCFPFSISNVQDEMIQNFIICGKYSDGLNIVFEYCWKQQVNSSNIKMVEDVSFDSVYTLVWEKTIAQCQQLLSNLNDRTIALKEIESLYQLFMPEDTNAAMNENERLCQKDNLSSQLCALCAAMHCCYPNSRKLFPSPNEWIPQAVNDIVLYNEMVVDSRCTKATNVIMKVKKSLKLEKDFKIIEDLQDHANADFKEHKLCEIDVHRWNDIRIMYSNAVLHKCLDIFSNNTKLVFWLREATNSVSQLSSFVEVCNSTAGEEEFNTKRLSYLHSVGSDFASLIYELPDDADFDKFDEKCKKVEDLIKGSSKLMDSLEECNKHLDWFVELKETQGSFEVTAMSKVIDIIQFGEYKISSSEAMPLLSIGDAIKLKIHRQNAVKKEYSLDDLRDLESKLVLITGKHTTEKAKTERFLNYLRLVCRIANALLSLQNAGHAQYITWSYSFYCDDIYSVLENQAMKMERELKRWTDEIAMARNNFHVLNLFTTQQLRVIRQQLGQLNCESVTSLPPAVISMLMSISSKICQKDVKECLLLVKSKSSLVEHHPPEKLEALENSSGYMDHEDNVQMDQFNPEDEVSLEAAVEKLVIRLIDQLSEVERNAYEELKEDYSDKMAYLSIKNCNKSDLDQGDLVEKASVWCLKNEDEYLNKDLEEVLNELQALCAQDNIFTENEQNTQCTDNVTPVSSVIQSQNDSVSLMEQTLIENFIPSGLAREAAELYPNDVEVALSYCLNEENKSSDQSALSLPMADGRKNPYTERYDKVKVNEYMDLDELAKVLEELVKRYPDRLTAARKFNDSYFTVGEPNLILVSSGRVLKTALSLYCELNQPFPSMDEIVICTSETTTEDIALLWRRAVWDPGYKQIFCLLFAEKLSYKVCDESVAELDKISQGKREFRIVIICSSESEETSHVVSKLLQFKRDYTIFQKDKELSDYLKCHFMCDEASSAAAIDPKKLSVRVVSSERPGMGKSLHVKRLAEKLKHKESYCSVPVHGPVVDFNTVMKLLQPFTPNYESPAPQIIHMDIDSEVLSVIDTILFSLLILKSLKNKNGDVWRLVSSQLYMIEVTYCENDLVNNLRLQQKSTLSLLKLLPSIKCVGPEDSLKPNQTSEDVIIDTDEFKNKAFQCVFQYLRRFDAKIDLKDFVYKEPSVEGDYLTCVTTIKKHCDIVLPSWAELAQFVRFLYVQLNDCQSSIYCNEEFFGEGAEFKKFIVEFMIKMSQDFAMRSLKVTEDVEKDEDEDSRGKDGEDKNDDGKVDWYQVKKEREWDKSQHPYIFFNQDHMTMTFVGFKVDETGQCLDFKSKEPIKGCRVPLKVCECLFTQGVNLQKEDCNKWTKKDMIERLWRVFGVDYGEDPDMSYVLTSDNFLKMMAIHMRFRCDIPVIIMGETGCGKTRLIRYMCDLQTHNTATNNLVMLKVHGGTTEEDINEAVVKTEEKAINNCKINSKLYTILFFDEANTTENIGLIKEIMCDRRLKGRKINDHVKFIAACNPYRKHTDEMIKKLETAGLGYYVKADSTQHKFGNIPLRHLVYRVLDLPLSMRPLLYDFGQVTGDTEDDYIRQIVTNHVFRNKLLSQNPALIEAISKLLLESQSFMRNEKDECSFVSLRDVERAMIVFEWFYENNDFFEELLLKDKQGYKGTNRETRSIILTLAVCYHARIQERENFVQHICGKFKPPISKEEFVEEISMFQSMILSQMDKNIPKNIARNAALKENVFMMLVCIELKIPLFVIGKPGSSKSLAKSIIENSMQGQSSNNKLCKQLKQVKLFSYQCSQHSTPSSILEVFTIAKRFQEGKDMKQPASTDRKNTKKFVSVVVLDEVGLAEDSPSLPLKALHPLLEDGTSGADAKIFSTVIFYSCEPGSVEYIAREDRVAFVGISNWALDPAKMNRGVMITRGSPDEKELEQSARGICSNEKNDAVRDELDKLFSPLSKAYKEICKMQTREFFGLRDFYSLIKMLYWMVSKTNSPLTKNQLIHAIQRNFDGLDEFNATKIFLSHIESDKQSTTSDDNNNNQTTASADNNAATISSENDQVSSSTKNIQTAVSADDTQIANSADIIQATVSMESDQPAASSEDQQTGSAEDIQNATFTEIIHAATSEPSKGNQALFTDCEPLELIKASLDTKDISWHGESRYLLFMTENFAALRVLQQHLLRNEDKPPFVLFGSSFPKDMEYTQVCRNINQIKICMETGRTVILLNLENLYESLYDVLNQYYTKLRENRYVDLGLQSHRIKCRVDDNFKMILIAEKETVYKDFPTPLINRLEKHFVVTSTILTKSQKEIMNRLTKWAKDFTLITNLKNMGRLKLGDAFVGYQEDTPAAVVFQAYHHIKALKQWEREDKIETSEEQKDQIFEKGKSLLLDIASPDAIVRLKYSTLADEFDAVYNTYFTEQSHSSLSELLSSKLSMSLHEHNKRNNDESVGLNIPGQKDMLLLQVTTHSHLLSEPDITQLCKALKIKRQNITHCLLQEFDTEMDFCNRLKLVMEQEIVGHKILIIQCDCGHLHSNLIACARHKVIDEIVVPQTSKYEETTEDMQASAKEATSENSKPLSEVVKTLKETQSSDEESVTEETQSKETQSSDEESVTEETQSFSKDETSDDTSSSIKETKSADIVEVKSKIDSDMNSVVQKSSTVHVVFIIQLPRKAGGTNFVGFQGGDWLSVHLDDLRSLKENELSFQSAIQCSISEIFNSMYQFVVSATSEKELEFTPLDKKLEPLSAEEEPKLSENSQYQSWSLNVPQTFSVATNKFQSVSFNANRRLRDLIQMACSWLYDTEQNRERTTWLHDTHKNRERTTKRISILTDLIPTESTRDMSSFDCRLVLFVTAVLKEMDNVNPEAKDWAFNEALKHSQISGTFRNALSRRVDKILLPILAKIIALIDKNFNLTIIHEHRDSKKISSPIAKLWLEIFSERTLCRISYEDIFTINNVSKTKKWVPGIGATLSDQFYKCTFPFSWICREVINAQKRDAAILAERYNVNSVKKMTELVASSPLGTIFNSCVPKEEKDAHKMLCCLYLNDYILSSYRPSMVDEQQLIYEAVNSRFNQLCGDSSTFLEKIVVLHIAYAELEPQLQQFQQLVSLSPKMVSSVCKKLKEDKDSDFSNEISDLALSAVKVLLIELTHGKNWDKDKTKRWIQDVSYYQNSINSILNLKSKYDSTKARKDWIRILVLKTFAITIGLHYNNDNTLAALQRLTTFLKNPDFKKVKILEHITSVLQNLQGKMKASWELKEEADFKDEAKQNVVKEYSEFISCCEKYFIEIITNFCFEQTYDASNPEPAMIDYLIDCIFVKGDSTKSITPFDERGGDTVPVVRSYLLQLLIDLEAKYTWEKLESYFTRSRSLAEENDTELHVLCVQCFEDKHYKNIERTKELAENCLNLLETNMNEYIHAMEVFTIKYFNVVAAIRFCLSRFSAILYEWCSSSEENQKQFPKEWLETLQTVKRLFSSHKSKYPAEYFIKHIIRQHGIKLFNQLKNCEEPSFQWIVPEHLKNKEESDHYITNPAVVYCGGSDPSFFDQLSESLTQAISSEDTTELDKVLKDMTNPNCCVMIMMAIYANVALKESPPSLEDQDVKNSKSSAMTVAHHTANVSFYSSPLPQVVASYLTKFIADSPSFNNRLKRIANDLLCGIHHFKFDVKMQALQPKQIFGVIIHCVTVFHQREDIEFLKPFAELLKRLSSMKAMYLPTMPEVCEFKSDLQLMGTYYICDGKESDGKIIERHRFLLIAEDCEKLDQDEMKCLFCQKPARKDESVKPKDEKATGHILGSAGSRSKDQIQERGLSSTNCSVLRVFLHAILTWSTSFIDKDNPPNLDGCISPPVPIENLEHFFLRNLEQDLITLSSSLGRSIDDAVLTIHLILKQLSQLPDKDFPGYIGKWSSCEERQAWENDFSETLIGKVIVNIEMNLRNTYTSAMKDTDTLYSRIYESKEESDPHFALWRYRTRLSLEHLSCSIQSKKHKILNMFLQQEPTLRAMQYLPGILKLQRHLFDCFHQQIGQEKALCETIGEYKKRLQKDNKEKMFTELVQLFNEAWLLLKNQLINYGRLRVPIEYTIDTPEITDDTKLAYLMPTSTGDSEGICSSSMVDFLVYQHNEFIQFCYKNMPTTYYDPDICQKFLENTIPLSQLQACHVLNYEHKLIPVILTHCQYSLRYGKGTKVDYDFEAIEKDLFDKFIFGKPLIFIDEMPKVVFRKDAHDATFYETIMASVPQESLQPEKKKTVTDEIMKLSMHRDPHKMTELLDVVEIVLGFLASAGGKPEQTFHNYVTKTLTMQRAHIPKGVKDCTLSTTVSLWRIVSVVQSCKLTTLDKEPFDRLDVAYCDPLEEARLLELQKTLKKIESPIDFLIALHNFIAVFVSHRSPTEDCNPEWSITEVWKEAMESSDFYHRVDLKSIIISDDIKMCHTAAVWKQAVGLLWPKENQQ